jgi:glycosyltransferase involved in cell wall biosynthesis
MNKYFYAIAAFLALAATLAIGKAGKGPSLSIIAVVNEIDDESGAILDDIAKNCGESELILLHTREDPGPLPNSAIRCVKIEEGSSLFAAWSEGAKLAKGDYLTIASPGESRNWDLVKRQVSCLENHPGIDLVYSDFAFEGKTVLREDFAPEKMSRNLPGPAPVWRKSAHDRFGYFRNDFFFSGDFEMWNRMAAGGAKMKKLAGTAVSITQTEASEALSTEKMLRFQWENNYIKHVYSRMWNPPNNDEPVLLIAINAESPPDAFFPLLDNYFFSLSGETRFRFWIVCQEAMDNPWGREGLKNYPFLDFTFEQDAPSPHYDILLSAKEAFEPVIWAYDEKIVRQMKESFPDFNGVLNGFDGETAEELNTYPIAGRPFIESVGRLYRPEYSSQYANEELTAVSRILGREKIVPEVWLKKCRPLPQGQNDSDKIIFEKRRKNRFDLDNKDLFEKEWSILICTLEERRSAFEKLYSELQKQIVQAGLEDRIEVLYERDNREKSIGKKRNELLRRARGKYMCFIDDDDEIHPEYIEMIYSKLQSNPDCLSLKGIMYGNDQRPYILDQSIIHGNRYSTVDGKYLRPPGHLNPMKKVIAGQFLFPDTSKGEDCKWAFAIANAKLINTEERIEIPYYFYLPSSLNPPKRERELLITCCARSGGAFITEYLKRNRLAMSHENDGSYGITSWLMAVDTESPPWGPPSNAYNFKHTLHQVRHPLKTIASAGNEPDRSWRYIQRFVPEIKLEDPKIVKGAKYWYYWNLLAEKKAELSYRVEHLDDSLDEINNLLGLNLDKCILKTIPKNVNTRGYKEVYSWQDLKDNLDPELYGNIVEMALRYGYHVED